MMICLFEATSFELT